MPAIGKVTNETLRGIVLRELDWKEHDKLLTVLTREHGRILVTAHGVKSMRNKNLAISQLFAYSEMQLTKRGDRWTLQEGSLLESFYLLRENLDSLTFAQYACEVCAEAAAEEIEDEAGVQQLLLNTLYVAQFQRDIPHLKAAFELRLCAISGFLPELGACTTCGKRRPAAGSPACDPAADLPASDGWRFDCIGGGLICPDCHGEKEHEERTVAGMKGERYYPSPSRIPLDEPCLTALRYVCFADGKRLFSFTLPDRSALYFRYLCERFLLDQFERGYKTLEFYHELFLPGTRQGLPPPGVKL